MTDESLLGRIVMNPEVMVGKPVIRGTRLTVEYILQLMVYADSPNEILAEYPGLVIHDIRACLLFAQKTLQDITFTPNAAGAA